MKTFIRLLILPLTIPLAFSAFAGVLTFGLTWMCLGWVFNDESYEIGRDSVKESFDVLKFFLKLFILGKDS